MVHARARNVIERIFGVMKKRYRILVSSPEFSLETQARIVCGLAVTHNFIRIHDPEDLPEPLEATHNERADEGGIQDGISTAEQNRASSRRDRIAAEMWAAYQQRSVRRRRNRR